jgi:hypothetical protein
LLAVEVHAANIVDTMSGCHVYQAVKSKFSSIGGGCGVAGYRGTFVSFVGVRYGEFVDVSEWIKSKLWQVLPKGWCVERTFAWAFWSCILSKDYEIKSVYEENDFIISHLHTLLKRY